MSLKQTVSGEEYNRLMFDLLLLLFGRQEAIVKLIITKLEEKGEDRKALSEWFDKEADMQERRLRELLFEKYGQVDLSELLKK